MHELDRNVMPLVGLVGRLVAAIELYTLRARDACPWSGLDHQDDNMHAYSKLLPSRSLLRRRRSSEGPPRSCAADGYRRRITCALCRRLIRLHPCRTNAALMNTPPRAGAWLQG